LRDPQRSRATRPPLNLDQLRLFVAVAEQGSLSAGARARDASPSLATRTIAALERSLGARLFERSTRRLKLTEAGAVVLAWARQSVEAHEAVTDDLSSLLDRPSGTIRLAVNHYSVSAYLPGLLDAFCEAYPEISLAVTTTDDVLDLVENRYDLAIHSGRIPDSRVVGLRLREFRRVLCAAPAYLRRRGVPGELDELAQHDCLVHATNEPLNWFFRRGSRVVAQPVRARIEADSHVLLLELARRGRGIARLGFDIVKSDLASGRLVEVLPRYRCVYATGELPGIWLIYPNRRVLYRTRVLIDFLAERLGGVTPGAARRS
jgi:LysR family transcriptional activator of dmlA